MAEHRFCKPTVVGSTPTLGSTDSSTNRPYIQVADTAKGGRETPSPSHLLGHR